MSCTARIGSRHAEYCGDGIDRNELADRPRALLRKQQDLAADYAPGEVVLGGAGGRVCQYSLDFSFLEPGAVAEALRAMTTEQRMDALLKMCHCGFIRAFCLACRHYFALKEKNPGGLVRTTL